MRKVKIGDVVEIRTRKGFAYAHYTHKHKLYGALLRVFNGIHDAPLNTYEDVVKQRPAFSIFFPLSAAVNKKIVSIVGNVAVPIAASRKVEPPVIRFVTGTVQLLEQEGDTRSG
jgi:hypothetical protein